MPLPFRLACKKVVIEYACLLVLVGIFLLIYVQILKAPISAVLPHLCLISAIWLAHLLLRLLLSSVMPLAWSVAMSSLLLTLASSLLISYYLLVLIGMSTWGRVITWPLIAAYAQQLPALSEALNVSIFIPLTMVILFTCALFTLTWRQQSKNLWMPDWVVWRGRIATSTSTAIMLTILACLAYRFHDQPSGAVAEEPLVLTFYADRFIKPAQSHAFTSSNALREKTNASRTTYQASLTAEKRNVVLIVVDALRAKQLAMRGYPRALTPNISRWIADGQIDRAWIPERTISVCSESSCGLMGLASSNYVHEFSEQPFLLSEVLRRHDYQINYLLGGDHTSFYDLKKAYGQVDHYFDGSQAKQGYANDDQIVLEHLKQWPVWNGKPQYFQFHLMSTHALGKRWPKFEIFTPAKNYYMSMMKKVLGLEVLMEDAFQNHYDNGAMQSDAIIADIIELLRSKDYLKNALVIITADHGEMLGENKVISHADGVYQPALDIPLFFMPFGFNLNPLERNGLAKTWVSQIDVAPTILHELKMPIPSTWTGRAMQSHSSIDKPRDHLFFQQGKEYGLIDLSSSDTKWKHWVNKKSRQAFAYELIDDPDELSNRYKQVSPELKKRWLQALLPLQAKAYEVSDKPEKL
jgi:glucan phosphoethanolaminetransferase (alkaline phosphatase superfamily)